jgi:hypothetical protein
MIAVSKLAQRDMSAGWRRVNPCLSTSSPGYSATLSAAAAATQVVANISEMIDDDSLWDDEYQPIVTPASVSLEAPPTTGSFNNITSIQREHLP